jgi:hypothetical protein
MRNRNHEPGLSPISNKDITNAFQNLKPFLPEGELTRSELLKRVTIYLFILNVKGTKI